MLPAYVEGLRVRLKAERQLATPVQELLSELDWLHSCVSEDMIREAVSGGTLRYPTSISMILDRCPCCGYQHGPWRNPVVIEPIRCADGDGSVNGHM
jgi:hypothetical protein